MTVRHYYTDAYRTEFTAAIVERSGDGPRVYLDETAFYPTSGGQPHDIGTLGGVAVVDVVDEDDRIAHVLVAPLGRGGRRAARRPHRLESTLRSHAAAHRPAPPVGRVRGPVRRQDGERALRPRVLDARSRRRVALARAARRRRGARERVRRRSAAGRRDVRGRRDRRRGFAKRRIEPARCASSRSTASTEARAAERTFARPPRSARCSCGRRRRFARRRASSSSAGAAPCAARGATSSAVRRSPRRCRRRSTTPPRCRRDAERAAEGSATTRGRSSRRS